MKVGVLIKSVSEVLGDTKGTTWEPTQLIEYLNDAQLAVASLRPDASQETVDVQLTAGQTEQTVGGRRLIAVHNNMGSDGNTLGDAIRLVDRNIKDAMEPGWHSDTPATAIKEYIYDAKIPKKFWVSPPVHASTAVYVKLTRAINPADVVDMSSNISLDDIYSPPMQEWILYRCFARDSEETPNYVRAAGHFENFFNLLGIKVQADMAISPKVQEQLK